MGKESTKRNRKDKKILLAKETPTLIEDLGKQLMGMDFDVWNAESIDQVISFIDNGFDSDKDIHIILIQDHKGLDLV